jgi:hypothetical protein
MSWSRVLLEKFLFSPEAPHHCTEFFLRYLAKPKYLRKNSVQ